MSGERLSADTTRHVYRMMSNVVRKSTYTMFLNGQVGLSYYNATVDACALFASACDKRVDNGESLTADDANAILKGFKDASFARKVADEQEYETERAKRLAWSLLEE